MCRRAADGSHRGGGKAFASMFNALWTLVKLTCELEYWTSIQSSMQRTQGRVPEAGEESSVRV